MEVVGDLRDQQKHHIHTHTHTHTHTQSYAGQYIPNIANWVVNNEDAFDTPLNLKGFAVGDACTGTDVLCGANGNACVCVRGGITKAGRGGGAGGERGEREMKKKDVVDGGRKGRDGEGEWEVWSATGK